MMAKGFPPRRQANYVRAAGSNSFSNTGLEPPSKAAAKLMPGAGAKRTAFAAGLKAGMRGKQLNTNSFGPEGRFAKSGFAKGQAHLAKMQARWPAGTSRGGQWRGKGG